MNNKTNALLLWLLFLPLTAAGATGNTLPAISSSGVWLPGKFIWNDLITDDVDSAGAFYSALLGWEFQTLTVQNHRYLIAFNQSRPVAGLLQAPKKAQSQGHPRWISYLSVTEVGQALQSVMINDGKILLAPKDLPNRGVQAIVRDSEGAVFGVMRTAQGDPEDFLAEPGDWIWIQLLSRDADKAARFYQSLADFTVIEDAPNTLSDSLMLMASGYARATLMNIPEQRSNAHPVWLPFVRVADLQTSLKAAAAAGGSLLLGPKPELLSGHLAVVADPTGAAIGLIQWDYTDAGSQ